VTNGNAKDKKTDVHAQQEGTFKVRRKDLWRFVARGTLT
jgi:hypothetical protein